MERREFFGRTLLAGVLVGTDFKKESRSSAGNNGAQVTTRQGEVVIEQSLCNARPSNRLLRYWELAWI